MKNIIIGIIGAVCIIWSAVACVATLKGISKWWNNTVLAGVIIGIEIIIYSRLWF